MSHRHAPASRARPTYGRLTAYDQGAHVTFVGPTGSHVGHKESVKDTARALGRTNDEYRGFAERTAD